MTRADQDRSEFRRLLAARTATAYQTFFGPVTAAYVPRIAAAAGPGTGKVALDVGSGTGHLAAALRRQGYHCTAIDHSPAIMRAPDPHGVPPQAVAADALALPFATGSVDLVCAAFLLSHVADLAALLGEFRRVLRPGGRVVLANWCAPTESPFNGLLVEILRRHGHTGLDHSLAMANPEHVSQHLNAAAFTGGTVERVQTTVSPVSAQAWLDGLLTGSPSLATALASLDPPTIRREFLTSAAHYTKNGQISVPATAYVLSARRTSSTEW